VKNVTVKVCCGAQLSGVAALGCPTGRYRATSKPCFVRLLTGDGVACEVQICFGTRPSQAAKSRLSPLGRCRKLRQRPILAGIGAWLDGDCEVASDRVSLHVELTSKSSHNMNRAGSRADAETVGSRPDLGTICSSTPCVCRVCPGLPFLIKPHLPHRGHAGIDEHSQAADPPFYPWRASWQTPPSALWGEVDAFDARVDAPSFGALILVLRDRRGLHFSPVVSKVRVEALSMFRLLRAFLRPRLVGVGAH
jgi:hypothetical protein